MNLNKPIFFSIVIPTYNRAHLISSTLESILSQGYTNYEVIIVDDGSTDNTAEVVKKFLSPQISYYKKENAERAAARNFGTLKAKGDYINWFDSDDIMFFNHLQVAANMIAKYKCPEVIAQGHQHQTLTGENLQVLSYSSDINREIYKGNPMANSPVIVRKDIAMANLFNEDRDLSGSEDFELWLRLAAKYKIYCSPNITVAVIYHPERSTIVMSDANQLIKRYTKFLSYTTSNPEILTMIGNNKSVFVMKNLLLLAVDLVNNRNITVSREYLRKAFMTSPKIVFERGFYAYIKHYIRHAIS